jgi:hypothetical protein
MLPVHKIPTKTSNPTRTANDRSTEVRTCNMSTVRVPVLNDSLKKRTLPSLCCLTLPGTRYQCCSR